MNEMIFDLKKGGKPYKFEKKYIDNDINNIIFNIDKPKVDRNSGTSGSSGDRTLKKETKVIVYNDISDNTYITHEDYLDYLEYVYESDNGYIIKPDFIWFTILCEMADYIKSDSKKFRKYYTISDKKIIIKIPSDYTNTGIPELPLDLATKEVMKRIPSALTKEMIAPEFSTSDEKSKMAFRCAFLESVKNYYQFGVVGCGFSKIKVLGTIEDYKLMISLLKKIYKIIPEFEDYFEICIDAINEIIKEWNNKYFWSYICWTNHGYSAYTVDGWFTKFFRNYASSPMIKSLFPKHIAKVEYIHNSDEYTMYIGILSSIYQDGFYIPDFTKIITKIINE